MNTPLLVALGAFMLALVHALVMEGWRASIKAGVRFSDGRRQGAADLPSISVIIPARDAHATLSELLQDLYAQDMPRDKYEVIVVDDHSSDATSAVVERMMVTWSKLKLIQLDASFGKKAAIMHAAADAHHDLIVLTDADGRCGGSRLSAIARRWASAPTDLLLMPVETVGEKGLHSHMQRMEQLALQAVAAGSGTMGAPVLANGANMAFSRSTFFQLGGFKGDRWASGDDMFLLQRMRRARKAIGYLLDADVVVSVRTENSWKAAIQQRLRWAGKMRAYRETMVMLSSIVSLLFPWLLAVATSYALQEVKAGQGMMNTVVLLTSAWMFWAIPILRLVHTMDVFFAHASRSASPGQPPRSAGHSWLSTIPALIAFMFYAPIIAILSIFVRPIWKGRRI